MNCATLRVEHFNMNKQKILIIGAGGGREHALGWKIKQSPKAGPIFFATGNAGTASLGTNLEIKPGEIKKLLDFSRQEQIDLTLVVSDEPLALGVVDEFRKNGLRVWGPTKAVAKLEASKVFSKNFMHKHNLPTAKFASFNDFKKAAEYVQGQSVPIVIKADGLAFGKGVVIAPTIDEALKTLEDIMVKKIFGDSGNEVVIEEFLFGPEISIHALSDGQNYKIFPTAQDHKRIGEGNTGPNTGGMGVVAPLSFVNQEIMQRIEKEIIDPTLKALRDEGRTFEGVLYPSLMLTKEGPKIIEFNVRFGDPECQVYMRLLDGDLLDIIDACIDKKLKDKEIKWKNIFACNIALASGGYPGSYEKGKVISGIEQAQQQHDIVVFHAGAKLENDQIVTNGGRVLGVSATGGTMKEALQKAYQAIEKISFDGMQYRKDIGKNS